MKKISILLLMTFSVATQTLNAQLDLPYITNFSAYSTTSSNRLTWVIANNKIVNTFEVERSTDGKDFKVIAVLMATEKFDTESYSYTDTATGPDIITYRLRIVSKNRYNFLSKVLLVRPKLTLVNNIRLMGNPVTDKLFVSYSSTNVQESDIKIYSLTGKILLNQKISTFKGNNLLTIPLSAGFAPGMYVLEINNDIVSQKAKFVKM